ncbi:MAG TPA: CHAT domain-containing protein [Longimicrobium sp.]|nr:CHAT domain-containing protein [Longimicrobium sp.]
MQFAPSWPRQLAAQSPAVVRRARIAAAVILVLLCLAAAIQLVRARVQAAGGGSSRGLLGALAREFRGASPIAPRLSIATAPPPCIDVRVPAPALPEQEGCAGAPVPAPSRRTSRIAARAMQAIRAGDDPEAVHAGALIDVLYSAGTDKQLERAIYSLRAVSRGAQRPAPVLSDLAAAYLVRAQAAAAPRDLLAAVEAAQEALEREPGNLAARFNLALALQRFGLVQEAAREWRAYLRADSTSGWAQVARRGLREAAAARAPSPPPAPGAPPAEYAAYAAAHPQEARLLGWNHLLGAWAAAVLSGSPAAGEHLRHAEAVGEALARRPGGDATLVDAVRAIRAVRGEPALRRLAAAHHEYAAGVALFDAAAYAAAASRLDAAAEAADGSPTLRSWARLFLGATHVYLGEREEGEAIFRAIAEGADTVRHPALAGRALWVLGATLLRTDRYDRALLPAAQAARLFARAGEREHQAAAVGVLADAQLELHDADAGYASVHQAVALLRPYPGSVRLHNALVTTAESAAGDGLLRAAVRVLDEDVGVVRRTGNDAFVAEALTRRARYLAAAGAARRAAQDLDATRAVLARVADTVTLRRLQADLRVAEAFALLAAQPARAARELDSATAFYQATQIPLLAFPALVGGAQARLAAGDSRGAAARLETAFGMLERRRDSIRMEPRRAAVFDAARQVADRVVLLRLAAGEPAEALRFLDRGRATLAAAAGEPSSRADGELESPPGEVVVELAVLADTLLVWTVDGRRVELYHTPIDTVQLVRTVTRLRLLLEGQGDARAVDAVLSELYELLIRPVRARLGGEGTGLVVVADGDLASVPFAALRDARRGRYLVQDHPVRYAVSLREARRAPGPGSGMEPAVFVADPAFAPAEHPGLRRLQGAAAEARSIAAEYPRPLVLADGRATGANVAAALGRARVVHYAGHAVFDDERPERSYLVLAPEPARPGSGRMTAEELSRLELRQAPLVVLAACRSVNAGRGRAGGFTGLAGALLAAGARGVVGGMWEVDDERTRPLMVEFHRAYRALGDGPAALRSAQLWMLRSEDPALRSPAAWAGFRYAGR